jgi:hypothetical protein
MTSTQQKFPWEVSWDEWKELEVAPTKELVALAKKLAARLDKSYGHKGAYLYHRWAEGQGKPAVVEWWTKYNAE